LVRQPQRVKKTRSTLNLFFIFFPAIVIIAKLLTNPRKFKRKRDALPENNHLPRT